MALDIRKVGATSGNGAEVNAGGQSLVVLGLDAAGTPAGVGGARMFSEVDAGTETGAALLKSPEVSADYRLRVGVDTLLFQDVLNSTAQNTTKWAYTLATLTATQSGNGAVTFSAVQGTTSSHGAFMRTFQYFPLLGTAPVWHEERWGQFTAALVANEVWSCGFGLPTAATTLPTEGAWFQLTTAGVIGRVCHNGVFTDSGVLMAFADVTVGKLFKFSIMVGAAEVQWWCDDVLLGTTVVPDGNGQPFLQGALPAFRMKHNTGAVSNTNTMRSAGLIITQSDLNTSKPWSHQRALSGASAYIGQDNHTQGKTQWWTNNTAPTAAAATNTAAISGATTLGGLVAVLPTLTANNDGNLFTYQNPVPGPTITGRNLIITGVKIQGMVTVIFNGGPVLYAYAVQYGHTAVSLATAEAGSFVNGTTHAPRTAFVGMESYPVTAPVGQIGQGCSLDLSEGPIVVRPGEFIAITARNMGTVTTTGAITIGATLSGYWE